MAALTAPSWLTPLRAIVGDRHVLTGEVAAGYCVDWTGRFRGSTPAVVRPGSTAEVAAVLAHCHRHGVPVVPQGGNTGLVGGGVPLDGELVLSLRRLDRLEPVDRRAAQVTVGAGVTLAGVQQAARAAGLRYPVDLGARESATVGGMVATNAGGVHVVRHGSTRRQVRGLEAVLADGSVLSHLAGLEKDNTGYDLAGLLCGSEGTLAVITAACLHLVPEPAERVVALVGTSSLDAALALARAVHGRLGGLEAAEVVERAGLRLVCRHTGLTSPLATDPPVVLLLEVAGEDPAAALADALDVVASQPGPEAPGEVVAATDASRRAALWRYREGHTEALARLGAVRKYDVTFPLSGLADAVVAIRTAVAASVPGSQVWIFGHLLDGNLHVNVSGVADEVGAEVDDLVLGLVASAGGSISAEHGVGRAKRAWLHLSRDATERRLFGAVKRAFDPAGLLNPGVLLEPGDPPPAG